MRKITAYIRPQMSDKVVDALRNIDVPGVTVLPCRGFGRLESGADPHYQDPSDKLGFVDKTKLEIVCADAAQEAIVGVIRESACTGRHGDGKIFVSAIDEATDIRTGNTHDVV